LSTHRSPTVRYPLSLHDALPIYAAGRGLSARHALWYASQRRLWHGRRPAGHAVDQPALDPRRASVPASANRSHTAAAAGRSLNSLMQDVVADRAGEMMKPDVTGLQLWLDALGQAVLVFDADGHLSAAHAAARTLLNADLRLIESDGWRAVTALLDSPHSSRGLEDATAE